jgi:hypothetical protein
MRVRQVAVEEGFPLVRLFEESRETATSLYSSHGSDTSIWIKTPLPCFPEAAIVGPLTAADS